jgi:hypothetical protein
MQIESTQYVIAAGAQYLMTENLELEVAWAILCGKCMAWHAAISRVENSAQGLSCQLNFVHDNSHASILSHPGSLYL